MRIILTLAVGCLLIALEGWLDGKAAFSGLLGVMGMAVMLRRCGDVQAVSAGVGKLWRAAEVMLFVLVGAAVDIRYTMQAGAGAVLLIALALVIRSVGVCLCVAGTKLTKKERLFCVIAYLPKATVQAAIGATPLAMGLPWRKSGAFRRRAGHFAHRAAGGNRHGRNGRQTAAKISWSFRTE